MVGILSVTINIKLLEQSETVKIRIFFFNQHKKISLLPFVNSTYAMQSIFGEKSEII